MVGKGMGLETKNLGPSLGNFGQEMSPFYFHCF